MTIRNRMWVTHILSFLIALALTTLFTCMAAIGFYTYVQKEHYVAPDNPIRFSRISDTLAYLTFRDIEKYNHIDWAIYGNHLMDPKLTSITLYRDGVSIYQYGNPELKSQFPQLQSDNSEMELLSTALNNVYSTRLYQEIDGHQYIYLFLAEEPKQELAGQLDELLSIAAVVLMLLLVGFFILLTFVQTKYTLRYMMRPIRELSHAADEVAKGTLDVEVEYLKDDEFKPIVERFNAMAKSLQLNQQLRDETERSRQELIAGISHDIRTPLTSIQAYVEGLLDQVATSPQAQQKYLQTIKNKTNEMDHTLSQLFLFSKLDLGEESLHLEKIYVHQLLRQYLRDNRDWYNSQGLTITLRINNTATIMGDESILIRSLENVLTNTVKYKVEEEAHSHITLTTIGDRAILTITDDGPGISPDGAKHIFDVFYRSDRARQNVSEGSGLGLAITAKYLELLGGSIKAFPVIPHGLQITMTLPLA